MGIQVKKWISKSPKMLYHIDKQSINNYTCFKKSGWNIEV
jgi:hypothetical protein